VGYLEDVAKIAGVHEVHLSREFRKTFGCTIGEYVRRLRVEFAAQQISLIDTPLGEIALAAGDTYSHVLPTMQESATNKLKE